jgi:phenylalanyl-tRNA synthetase beta chain
VVYDLEITPNRPDLNSLLGIAREIAALTGNPLRVPAVPQLPASSGGAPVVVRLEAPDLCPRYTAQVIRGVRVGPSPDWLRSALEKVGLRSINNVVDVSNYVMLETGQPLHTFDLHLIAKAATEGGQSRPTLVIRRAAAGEAFTTLDNKAHVLSAETLLIADTEKGIALAGVMGGLNTEIRDTTTDVLIESAYFTPTHVRRTSKSLGLRTDASYRYERGADPEAALTAGRRCAQLILATAGGSLDGELVDARAAAPEIKVIELQHHRVAALLGVDIPVAEQTGMLVRLGLSVEGTAGDGASTRFRVPSWRVDLKREVDLIEEIARLYGVDRIPSTTPRRANGSHAYDAVYDQLAEIRRLVASLGLHEAQGQTLINDAAAKLVVENPVLLANPLSSDMNALRPSLIPGLVDSLSHNLSRRNGDVQLFEIGRVFSRQGDGVKEGWRLAFALTGARNPQFWSGADRDATCDLSDLKGIIEEVLEYLGLRGVQVTRRAEVTPLWVESATIALGGKLALGQMGQMQPVLAKRRELRDAVLLAELDLDLLLARRNSVKSFKPLPQFPAIRRDIAMIVPESVTHDAVLGVVRQAKPANLESIEAFDVFRGRHVPAGQKSLAYALTFRAADRTLREDDVTPVHAKIVAGFRETLAAVIRE